MLLIKRNVLVFIILKIELTCDEENYVNFNAYSFQKKTLPNLTYVLIYSLIKCVLLEGSFKESCLLKNLEKLQRYIPGGVSCWRNTVYCYSPKYDFLGIHKIFNITNGTNMEC